MSAQDRAIAVVDDDLRVVESLVNLLASYGYEAEGYSSAEQFLCSDGLSKSCCVITDVEMRQMSGLGLLQHVKGINCTLPVIIITGKPSENSEVFYLNEGAAGFFRKPIDGNGLLDLIASVCGDPPSVT